MAGRRGRMRPRPGGACAPGPGGACTAREQLKEADRAPIFEAGSRGAAVKLRFRPGAPAAPERHRLRLLPSGPDLVHGLTSRRDRTINTTTGGADPGA